MYVRLDRFLRSHPALPYVAMWGSLVATTLADYFKGPGFSSFTFYLLPIGLAAWYAKKPLMIFMVLLSTALWSYCQTLSGPVLASPLAPYWNALLRFVTFALFAYLIYSLRVMLESMTAMAMRDGLTQLSNGRAFIGKYDMLRAMSVRRRNALALALIDLDGFKGVNDTHGHLEGDKVLRTFARVLKDVSRTSDIIARQGGDEFAMILIDASEAGVKAFDARLREAFAASGLKGTYGVDYCMGVAIFETPPQTAARAVSEADALMYQAKETGRSKTVLRFIPGETAR